MAKKEKFDVDKEIERISRKTRVNIMKSERLFESRINQLENDIDSAINSKEKLFDENNAFMFYFLLISQINGNKVFAHSLIFPLHTEFSSIPHNRILVLVYSSAPGHLIYFIYG